MRSLFLDKKVDFGLALSGGGSRGLAHIGVLKALEEAGIHPEILSGTSMGAVMGAFIGAGYTAKEIEQISKKSKIAKLFQMNRPKLGLTGHSTFRKELTKYLPDTFEELDLPLHISTTNLSKGENQIFTSGPLIEPILASMAIPVVFKPVSINDDFFVDGGLTNNLPTSSIRDKCNRLIGSHVNFIEPNSHISSIKDVMERCFRVAIFNTVRNSIDSCDLFVEPEKVRKFKTLDFNSIDEIIQHGYDAAVAEIIKHKESIKKPSVMDWIKNLGSNN